jgi:hypothetical protein
VRRKAATQRVVTLSLLALAGGALVAKDAAAEVTLVKEEEGWELFATGRVNAFFSYARGDARPQDAYDTSGNLLHAVRGGGMDALAEREANPTGSGYSQGTIEGSRVRSGFLGNIFGFGLRRNVTETTTMKAYISIWAFIESEAHRKYWPVIADVREGYMKFEGPWGSFLAGRALTLFSRGATDIDFRYGHGYALGYPGDLDVHGPTAGQIGFGVLGSGFAAGLVYATPPLAGLQLSVGYYDPANIVGSVWERTKWGRPEAELTYDVPIGNVGKIHLFGNGTWQKLYQKDSPKDSTIYGAGYGGRFEVGPVRLGVAGHYGRGLGISYALDPSEATYGPPELTTDFRVFDGYYAQTQVVIGKFDVGGGAGVTRIRLLDVDVIPDPMTGQPKYSIIKQQLGVNAIVVYHMTDYLHLALDYFRADFSWWLGEKQVVHFLSSGVTTTW